jgi:hypothetical protein
MLRFHAPQKKVKQTKATLFRTLEKGTAIPCTGLDRPWGFWKAVASRFQDKWQMVRSWALRSGRLYPPEKIPGTHSCYRLSRPQGHSAAEGLCQWKIPMTPSRPGRYTPGNAPVSRVSGGGWAPAPVWTCAEIFAEVNRPNNPFTARQLVYAPLGVTLKAAHSAKHILFPVPYNC